ncbi:hypothetical protein KKG72_11440 [bacterium]|nr:hypothetical protein [bacterium]MBU1994697.1 hypothetical protein [bacterium]
MQTQAIKTEKYMPRDEIQNHLQNVEYIIMAAPAPEHFKDSPIHFTIFLNTSDNLPQEIQEAVLEKFLKEQKIGEAKELMSQLMPVGFALSTQETPMPMLLVKQQDREAIPHAPMFVMDFLADSSNFDEAKNKSFTGWSYSYN